MNIIKQSRKFIHVYILERQVFMMMERKIMLRVDEVKAFVEAASKCDFDIDIFYNSYSVDAKSILGVMGLDLRQVLTVRCNGYCSDFDNYLRGFAIAG